MLPGSEKAIAMDTAQKHRRPYSMDTVHLLHLIFDDTWSWLVAWQVELVISYFLRRKDFIQDTLLDRLQDQSRGTALRVWTVYNLCYCLPTAVSR